MYGAAPLQIEVVRNAVRDLWELRLERVDYEPIGYGSYHWKAATADGFELFVTADLAAADSVVPMAYGLARHLADDGLSFVRAPLLHRRGGVTWDVDGWSVSVWPWLERRISTGHGHPSTADLEATGRCLHVLHEHRAIPPVPGLVEDWAIAERERFFDLLDLQADERESGPYAEEVRSRLSSNRHAVERMSRRYDELVELVEASGVAFVITHGEPHAANVVHTDGGLVLIDWDTVRWAPRERDLWALGEGWRIAYGDVAISDEILELYRLQWALGEIAEFSTDLVAAASTDPDLDVAMRELRVYLPE